VDLYERHRVKLALSLNLVAVALITFYLLPKIVPFWGQGDPFHGGTPVSTETITEPFDRGTLGDFFLPVQGEVGVREGVLLIGEGLVVSKQLISMAEDAELSLELVSFAGEGPPAFRLGLLAVGDVEGRQGFYVELDPGMQRGVLKVDGQIQVQFPYDASLAASIRRLTIQKAGYGLRVFLGSRILVDAPRMYADRGARTGRVSVQTIGGVGRIDSVQLKIVRYQ
jgi:hypothetical protein